MLNWGIMLFYRVVCADSGWQKLIRLWPFSSLWPPMALTFSSVMKLFGRSICLVFTPGRRDLSSLRYKDRLHYKTKWFVKLKTCLKMWFIFLQNGILNGVYPGSAPGFVLVMAGYMGRAHYLKVDPSLGLLFKIGKHVPIRYKFVYIIYMQYILYVCCFNQAVLFAVGTCLLKRRW